MSGFEVLFFFIIRRKRCCRRGRRFQNGYNPGVWQGEEKKRNESLSVPPSAFDGDVE